MIFWLGDLNYRFDDLDPDQVKILVDKHDYEKLHTNDQVFYLFIYLFFYMIVLDLFTSFAS